MSKKYFIIHICLLLSWSIQAQVGIGINTELPTASLTVKTGSTTLPTVKARNSDNTEMFKILDNGYVGTGGASPIVKLDLRSTTSNGELGLGTTTITAEEAKAGAIRYNDGVEYSDGTTWIKLTTLPAKAFVLARNSTGIAWGAGSNAFSNWNKEMDVTNSFNETTGRFTAPRTGVYSVSCSAMAENVTSAVNPVLRLELNLVVSSTTATSIKSAIAVPIILGAAGINMTIVNKSFVYLQANDYFYFSVWNGINEGITLTTDGSYNTLTISEM